MSDTAIRLMVTHWMQGNQAAIDLVYDLANIAHLYDDLIDQDQRVDQWRVHDAFLAAMVRVPRNPIFRQFGSELTTLIETSIFNWRAANTLASIDVGNAHVADVIRYSFAEIVIYVARLVGGHQHAATIAADVWANIRNDTFDGFLKEHGHAATQE